MGRERKGHRKGRGRPEGKGKKKDWCPPPHDLFARRLGTI